MMFARYARLSKSGEQTSSVPDQLQREVGRSRNSEQTREMCREEMEDRETDGGKKQRGMNQRVKRHRGGGRMLGDTLELCQLQEGKCVCVCDRRTDRQRQCSHPAGLAVM